MLRYEPRVTHIAVAQISALPLLLFWKITRHCVEEIGQEASMTTEERPSLRPPPPITVSPAGQVAMVKLCWPAATDEIVEVI